MNRTHPVTAAVATVAVLLLTGCTTASPDTAPAPGSSTGSSSTVSSGTQTPAVTSTPSPSDTSTPTPISTSTSTTGFTTQAQQPAAAGCGAGHGVIPAGASTATIGDVDHDGHPDTEFISTRPRFEYGIRTATGDLATITITLTGAGTVNGWTATGFDGPLFPLTVIDDGKQADLYAYIGCRFIRTLTTGGTPFTFRLGHASAPGSGTGVACTDQNGGQLLARADAVALTDGRYDIRWTTIHYTDQGHHAAFQPPAETRYTGLHPDDPPVAAANTSDCLDTPIVHGSST